MSALSTDRVKIIKVKLSQQEGKFQRKLKLDTAFQLYSEKPIRNTPYIAIVKVVPFLPVMNN